MAHITWVNVVIFTVHGINETIGPVIPCNNSDSIRAQQIHGHDLVASAAFFQHVGITRNLQISHQELNERVPILAAVGPGYQVV